MRYVVSRGFGNFDVIEGRKLNDAFLTKEDAEALAAATVSDIRTASADKGALGEADELLDALADALNRAGRLSENARVFIAAVINNRLRKHVDPHVRPLPGNRRLAEIVTTRKPPPAAA